LLNSVVALFNAGAAAAAGDYESIATVTVGSGGAANVEFTSIAADWTHLQIRGISRSDRASGADPIMVRFNSDGAANYTQHALYGEGANAVAANNLGEAAILNYSVAAANSGASIFGVCVIDILDYANANKYKTLRSLGGYDNNGAGTIALNSGAWLSSSAISTIRIYPFGGSNFVQYSHFALYGIKGA